MEEGFMNIVVCIKQVPDTTEVKLDPNTGTLIRDGVPSIINPDDKAGLEEAIKLKEEMGAHVTVITMGPPQADMALKEALAMGADRGILLTDRAFAGADTWATSSALAGALKNIDFEYLVLGHGKQVISKEDSYKLIEKHLNALKKYLYQTKAAGRQQRAGFVGNAKLAVIFRDVIFNRVWFDFKLFGNLLNTEPVRLQAQNLQSLRAKILRAGRLPL